MQGKISGSYSEF